MADDVWLPNKLVEQVAIMNERPDADALYGDTLSWYGWTGVPEDAARDVTPKSGIPEEDALAPRELITGMLRHEITVPCTCSMIVRADAVRRSGGFVDELRYIYTDQAFYARLSMVSSVLYVDRCWDRYRRHAASADSSCSEAGEPGGASASIRPGSTATSRRVAGERDPALRTALRAALRRVRYPRLFAVIDGVRDALRGRR